jgi:hypothetical protein
MPFSLTASSPDSLLALTPGRAPKTKSYELALVALGLSAARDKTTISKLASGIIADVNCAVKPYLV